VDEITPQQLQEVLVHELAHVGRHDPFIVLLQNLAATFFWVHPLVKVLNRQLAQAREEVCDNYALAASDARSYGRTLLKLATLAQPGQALAGAVELFNARWKLERRVAGLLDDRRSRRTRLTWRGGALLSRRGTRPVVVAVAGGRAERNGRCGGTSDDPRHFRIGRQNSCQLA
jgi:beta-lactamase regulating signal transducer with metallopeptidase domain